MKLKRKDTTKRCISIAWLDSKGAEIEDVEHRIRDGWLKCKLTSRGFSDWRIATGFKRKFYTKKSRQLTYGSECWPIRKQQNQKISIA